MTNHINFTIPAATPADWADIARRRPIEDLFRAPTAEACFDHVLAVLRQTDPAEVPSVEVLIDALSEAKITEDDHSSVFRRGINAVLLNKDLRPAIWIALAIKGLPGAASEVSSAYAVLAHDMSMFVIQHGPSGRSQSQLDIAQSLSDRIFDARIAAVGWAIVASGSPQAVPNPGISLSLTANALGAEVNEDWTENFGKAFVTVGGAL